MMALNTLFHSQLNEVFLPLMEHRVFLASHIVVCCREGGGGY